MCIIWNIVIASHADFAPRLRRGARKINHIPRGNAAPAVNIVMYRNLPCMRRIASTTSNARFPILICQRKERLTLLMTSLSRKHQFCDVVYRSVYTPEKSKGATTTGFSAILNSWLFNNNNNLFHFGNMLYLLYFFFYFHFTIILALFTSEESLFSWCRRN